MPLPISRTQLDKLGMSSPLSARSSKESAKSQCRYVPVEIQVRTAWQDHWAQFVEHIGDDWGRGLRYGEDSELQKVVIDSRDGRLLTRLDVVEKIIEVSDRIYQYESDYRGGKQS